VLPESAGQQTGDPMTGAILDPEKPVGSSSFRRNLQLRKLIGDSKTSGVRGNVLTRLAKLDRGDYSALVLAYAGLKRLGLEARVSKVFDPADMIPAAGQGVMAVQGRAGENYDFLDCVNDKDSETEALAERAFVRELDGGCSSPVAAFARAEGDIVRLTGLYYIEEKDDYITGAIAGDRRDAEALGRELALQLKGRN
jgi:hydroxymethylbilane synthase